MEAEGAHLMAGSGHQFHRSGRVPGSRHVPTTPRWLSAPGGGRSSALGTLCLLVLPFVKKDVIFKYNLSPKLSNFYIAV